MHWLTEFKDWYLSSLATGGYPLVILLMAMESSIFPVPAEGVVPLAAYIAHTQGHMHPLGVLLAATLGSWIGATVMYWVSRWAGRPLVLRYGRYFLIPPAKLEQAELWSRRFGLWGVFIARLLPVIRHLIGIPSGILRLDFLWYSVFTLAGSFIWCAVLVGVGVYAGDNPQDIHKVSVAVIAAALLLGLGYFWMTRRLSRPVTPSR